MRFDSARPAAGPDTRTPASRVRLAPRGHQRPRIRRAASTFGGHGPQTFANQAALTYLSRPATNDREPGADGYVLRPRATNDREPGATHVRFAPTVHKRPRIRRQRRTSCAHGPQTTANQTPITYDWTPPVDELSAMPQPRLRTPSDPGTGGPRRWAHSDRPAPKVRSARAGCAPPPPPRAY